MIRVSINGITIPNTTISLIYPVNQHATSRQILVPFKGVLLAIFKQEEFIVYG